MANEYFLMNDNRLTERLTKYWSRIKKDEVMPDFRKNNPAVIEDLWEQCFVLSVVPPNCSSYKYEYLGEKIKKIYTDDLIGLTFDLKGRQFPNSVLVPRLRTINSLLELKSPQEDTGKMPISSGKIIKYRTITLPFGNKKAGITHIVVGVSYREF